MTTPDPFAPTDRFEDRHLGPSRAAIPDMLESLGFESLDELVAAVVPESIRLQEPLTVLMNGKTQEGVILRPDGLD
jgi:glycine cleavage system pyridoxal-binding protein P